eukprot:TRINITY_DN652_c0_g1_i1.p1 TRINITY_DN652_c0_g1~~TRINITY_DN652_c0_g1_i1.p1  ORF type:complete len:129 (+),score=27.44 TRINITY_DN652_c0_g1_i1:29-415(+)
MPTTIGVPIKLLHESEGHKVTVELINGEVYRGHMMDVEDNMNCQMQQVTVTARDGKISKLETVYIRGSKVRFMILPDMLKNAPMFKRMDPKNRAKAATGLGIGRGAAIVKGKSQPSTSTSSSSSSKKS